MGRLTGSKTRQANDARVSSLQKVRVAKSKELKEADAYGKRPGSGIKRRV